MDVETQKHAMEKGRKTTAPIYHLC